MEATDAELVTQAIAGSRAAFDELVARHRQRATAAAIHLLGDVHGAEDMVQESFLAAFERIRSLRDPRRFSAWFHCILQRKCTRHRKQMGVMASLEELPEPAAPEPEDESLTELVHDVLPALNNLPLVHREILAARYLGEMNYKEIAEMLGLSVNTVRVRCFRAKMKLREVLKRTRAVPQRGGVQA